MGPSDVRHVWNVISLIACVQSPWIFFQRTGDLVSFEKKQQRNNVYTKPFWCNALALSCCSVRYTLYPCYTEETVCIWVYFCMHFIRNLITTALTFHLIRMLKSTFSTFSRFFPFSLTWSYGSKHFKSPHPPPPPQIAFQFCQISPEYSSQRSSEKYCFEFLKPWLSDFHIFYPFKLTWDPMGAKHSKSYFCLKSLLFIFFSKFFWFSSH